MGKKAKTAAVWIALILLFLVSFSIMTAEDETYPEDYAVFLEHVEEGRVGAVHMHGSELTVTLAGAGARRRLA